MSDEEIGSTGFTSADGKAGAASARRSLCWSRRRGGLYKTARKGIAGYTIRVKGVAAHSGVDFEEGHSAIAELARQVGVIQGFDWT